MTDTEEKTMKNSMAMPMQDLMESEMTAMPKKMNITLEQAVNGCFKNYKIELESKLSKAKEEFADAVREDDNWTERNNKDKACSVIEGQLEIINECKMSLLNILTPFMSV